MLTKSCVLGKIISQQQQQQQHKRRFGLRPSSARCLTAVNLAACWNKSEALRDAMILSKANGAAKKLAQSVRHL